MQNYKSSGFYGFIKSMIHHLHFKPLMVSLLTLSMLEAPAMAFADNADGNLNNRIRKDEGPGVVKTGSTNQQAGNEVKGTVKSADGETLPGVVVQVKGTNRGVVTDMDGNFTIRAGKNAVLEVSYLGYAKQEIKVDGRTQIDITLKSEATDLEEVVVVGYGTIQKSDFTGSSSTARMDGVNESKVISVPEALQGKVSGVQIMNNTGQPGSGITFNIRGTTSITGSSQPLVVIDGQPIESGFGATMAGAALDGGAEIPPSDPLASLNPDDIESIEILKDASSTAIYGSRGANGVVLITTKSGKEGRDRVVYSNRFDVSVVPKKLKVLSSLDYMNYRNEANLNDGKDSLYVAHQLDSISRTINVDWQDVIYKPALSQQHQMSLSGKDDKSSYYITGSYSNNNSIMKNADFTRYGLRVNLTRNVSQKISVGIRSYFSLADRNYGQESNWTGILGSSAVMGALAFNPLRGGFNDDGTLDEEFANSPAVVTTLVKDRTQMRTLVTNVNLDYKITKNLTYTVRGGVNDLYSLRELYYPTGTFIGNSAPGGSGTRADNNNSNYLIDNILTYKKMFAKKHRVNVVGVYSYQKWQNKSSSATGMSFPSNAMIYYNMQTATYPGRMYTGTKTRALASVLGRANYSFDNRYTLMLTGRYDGASRLAAGNKWQLFPSVGMGWNVSNENFFKDNIKLVNNLKLRASYGISGNENIAIGATKANYGVNYGVIGTEIVPGYVTSDFENPNLTWEKTKQYNFGVDFGFADDWLTVTIDAYRKNTTDLLINLALPASSGYGSYFTNVGEVMNQGIDIEATASVYSSRDARLTVSGNISKFENRVIDMGPAGVIYGRGYFAGGAVLLSQPVHVAMPGLPISTFWGYKTDGIYQNQEEIMADPALRNDDSRSLYAPGDVKWVDLNGDGQINDADKTAIGNPNPDFTYGFNTNFSYKRFTLGVTMFGSYGNELINLTRWIVGINNTTGNYNLLQDAYDGRWRGEGTSNKYPKVTTNGTRLFQRVPDWLVEDASFLRIQNVNLGYLIHLPKGFGARSVRAFVSGTNLHTWTKYTGYDPNINAFGHLAINRGVDLGTMGQARTFSTGLEVNF
ncbi:SusC/RagA family TonB-linked outer membrane protein [Botryobacter ruber]|uniref:SusC/RagA family TonB-linked outer membrane protein n=1 Tax=Botryobacter ruber TaxID=2171629 RepID=UPI000E0C7437|nr:TonB-dependent receptor [Botryobacter ruber]